MSNPDGFPLEQDPFAGITELGSSELEKFWALLQAEPSADLDEDNIALDKELQSLAETQAVEAAIAGADKDLQTFKPCVAGSREIAKQLVEGVPSSGQIQIVHRARALINLVSNIEPEKIVDETTNQTQITKILQVFTNTLYSTKDGRQMYYKTMTREQFEKASRESLADDNPDFEAHLRRFAPRILQGIEIRDPEQAMGILWSAACFMRLRIRVYKDYLADEALAKLHQTNPPAAAA